MWHVYLLVCRDNTIYTGIALDVLRRFKEHQSLKGASYTRSRGVKKIIHTEEFKTRGEALKREYEIKNLSRRRKLELAHIPARLVAVAKPSK